jgi:hypothetical protein
VSDFLGRMAARAVGQATVAQPRVRALFAELEPASAESRLEVVKTEAPTAAAVPNGVPETPRTESPARTSSPQSEVAAARVRSQPRSSIANLAEPVAGSDALRRSDDPPARLEAEIADAAPIDAEIGRQTPAEAVTAALPILAVPASPAPPEAVSVAREEPPRVVRVHIGRLEVRANVQEPRSPAAHRESPRQQELSLADYLRGRREAG